MSSFIIHPVVKAINSISDRDQDIMTAMYEERTVTVVYVRFAMNKNNRAIFEDVNLERMSDENRASEVRSSAVPSTDMGSPPVPSAELPG
jgi:hypothetical protein